MPAAGRFDYRLNTLSTAGARPLVPGVFLMPLFDFHCRSCEREFELLIRGNAVPVCPECGGKDLERLLSLPIVKSETTRSIIKRETKRRDASQAAEREHAQRQYEASHDD